MKHPYFIGLALLVALTWSCEKEQIAPVEFSPEEFAEQYLANAEEPLFFQVAYLDPSGEVTGWLIDREGKLARFASSALRQPAEAGVVTLDELRALSRAVVSREGEVSPLELVDHHRQARSVSSSAVLPKNDDDSGLVKAYFVYHLNSASEETSSNSCGEYPSTSTRHRPKQFDRKVLRIERDGQVATAPGAVAASLADWLRALEK